MEAGSVLHLREPLDSREGKLTLLALLMMMYVITLFISVTIHEVLGHGLFTVLLGGQFYAFYVSPGNGFASLWLPQSMTAASLGLVYMAGMLVQMVIGAIVLFLVLPRLKGFMSRMFALMFCVVMLVQPSMYLVMGYYYRGGDTWYAVTVLGVSPDAFLVAGIILTGLWTILISMAALRHMGEFMDLDDDRERSLALARFWLPPLLLSGIIAFLYSLTLPGSELSYPLVNSLLLIMFITVALFLVPEFSEPERKVKHSISMRSVLTVAVCFVLLMAGWAGVFGLSKETARGVMIHAPPVQAEVYYSDYTIGNAEFTVYLNGTVRADIILRNIMEDPSPLDARIYRTFDLRPDWDRYMARSRNMLITMFNLPRNVGEGLEFSTDFGTVRAKGVEDELGRRCTTYICLGDIGTRQYLSPGMQTYQPGMGIVTGDYTLNFVDPWFPQGGYLDEVRVTWEDGLEAVEIQAWNDDFNDISYNRGYIRDNTIGWKNINHEGSPAAYMVLFKIT